jgi:Helix-turn-helix domain
MSAINLRASYFCASEVIRERQRRGQPTPDWLRRHYARLDAEIRMSESGHELSGDQGELELDELITASEVAQILGISKRQAQRLAADLDGKIVGGRWIFTRAAVIEYSEGKCSA